MCLWYIPGNVFTYIRSCWQISARARNELVVAVVVAHLHIMIEASSLCARAYIITRPVRARARLRLISM